VDSRQIRKTGQRETPYSAPGAVADSIDPFSIFAFSADVCPRDVDGP
jgi:hypothetical protein